MFWLPILVEAQLQRFGHFIRPTRNNLLRTRGTQMTLRVYVSATVGLLVCNNLLAANASIHHWSIGASAGPAHYSIDTDSLADSSSDPRPTSADDRSVAHSIRAVFSFNPYFSVQGSYSDLGAVSYEKIYQCTTPGTACPDVTYAPIDGRFRATALGMNVIGTVPLSRGLDLSGGVGTSFVSYRNKSAEVPGIQGHRAIDHKSHQWSPTLQVGLQWHFAKRWSAGIGVDGTWDVSDTRSTGRSDIYRVSIGLDYRFGAR
jgi:opacity protein-like surface antigen